MTYSTQDQDQKQRDVILAGWDGGERSRDALALAAGLARELSIRVRVAHVYPDMRGGERRRKARGQAEELIRGVPKDLLSDVPFDEELIPAPSPAEGLYRLVLEPDVRFVALGSTHRGALGSVLPGGVASHLLHGSPCAVAVAPAGYADVPPARGLRSVAVAYDGSPSSTAALEEATNLALAAEATLRVISVVAPATAGWVGVGTYYAASVGAERALRQEALNQVLPTLPAAARADGRIRDGDPAAQIVDECEKGIDLLVMGSRGYGLAGRVLLGSVSDEVLRSAPCPVLVVPQAALTDDPPTRRETAAATV